MSCAQDRAEALVAALGRDCVGKGRRAERVEALLAGFARRSRPGAAGGVAPGDRRCFAGESVEAILDALATEAAAGGADAGWAAETPLGC